MKLIVPIPYYVSGGVEKVMTALLGEFSQQIEQVIVVASPRIVKHFQDKLPSSTSIIYEHFGWSEPQDRNKLRFIGLLNKILSVNNYLHLPKLNQSLLSLIEKINHQDKLNYLIAKYQATHCLYMIANRVTVPKLTIPLAMISHDLFWRYAPLTYPYEYIKIYDDSLSTWLNKADLIFTVSEKTRQEIIKNFRGFEDKIKTIPNSGYGDIKEELAADNNQDSCSFTFYFPSSFSLYKDHFTLLKAVILLEEKKIPCKVILTGKDTDKIIKGDFALSKQQKSQEYAEYVEKCQKLYEANQRIISQYCQGLGYCSDTEVESCYRYSDCVIIPSVYEGFGLALSEAVIRGLPVIATDLDVFHEQVALYRCDDRVFFFPQKQAEVLANLMESIIKQPPAKLSALEAKQRFSHWQWQQVATTYLQSLENIDG